MRISASAHFRGLSPLLLGAAGVALLSPDLVMAQCALCRDAAASSPSETREAMNYAIIGLALTPYGVATLAAWVLSPALRQGVRSRLRRLTARAKGAGR